MKPVDLRLNAIIDPERAGGRDPADLARRVAEGGATLVQLRDKKSEIRAMVAAARAIKAALTPFGGTVRRQRSDRRRARCASRRGAYRTGRYDGRGCAGVARPGRHNRRFNQERRSGGSGAGRHHQLCRRRRRLYDAVEGAEDPPIGPEGLSRIVKALRRRAPNLPIAGIAGIDASNAAAVIAAGADGIAVISALTLAPDPAAAARALREIVDGMLAKRSV